MLTVICSAMGPIIFVLAIGFFCGKKNYFSEEATQAFASFVVNIALPLALFLAAATVSPNVLLNGKYFLSIAVGLIVTFIIGLLCSRLLFKHNTKDSAGQALAVSFPDMAYCGPPVLLATVGSSGLISMVIGNIIYTVIIIPVVMLLLSRDTSNVSIISTLKSAVQKPLVILPVLGAILAISGIKLPKIVYDSVDEAGKCAGGVALFFLGLMIARIKLKANTEIIFNVFIKNILQGALILGTGLLLGLDHELLKAAFVIGFLPTATAVPAICITSKAYVENSASTVLLSTLCSFVTIIIGIIIIETCL